MVQIVVDGGGTNLRVASMNGDKEIGRLIVPTSTRSYDDTFAKLNACINEVRGGQRCEGIGVSIAGSTDGEQILAAGNLGALRGRPLGSDLSRIHGCPAWLFNDSQAMGASEYSVQGRPLILAIWGSGVNFAFVLGDDIFSLRGEGPSLIGEGGHQTIVPDGWVCGCGQSGCLEAYVGGSSIRHHYGRAAEHLSDDKWDTVLGHMAHGLHNVITLTGGKLPIYFAGGIACKQSGRLDALKDKLASTRRIVPELPAITCCTHGEDAGLHGASIIVQRQLDGP